MKQSQLRQIIKEETAKVLKEKSVNEKLNFVLGPTIHGDPNKPMKDSFKIVFKDPRKALIKLMDVNNELKQNGYKMFDYENMGFVINKPSNQQMQFILNAFDNSEVESIGRVLKEVKKSGLKESSLLTEAAWPIGHFEVINSFKITPGGGWQVSFNKGDILRVEDAAKLGYPGIQKIVKWDALKNDWVTKRPPISGMEVFPIDKFSGSYNWVGLFTQNTKALSKGAAESKAKAQEASTITTAKDAIKMLQGLSQNQQVKITIVK